jgi:hypothetical protein
MGDNYVSAWSERISIPTYQIGAPACLIIWYRRYTLVQGIIQAFRLLTIDDMTIAPSSIVHRLSSVVQYTRIENVIRCT